MLWLRAQVKETLNGPAQLDTFLAALMVQADAVYLDADSALKAFGRKLNDWDLDAESAEVRLTSVCDQDNIGDRAVASLSAAVENLGRKVNNDERNVVSLLFMLHRFIADNIYGTFKLAEREFNPETHLQIGIVTWLNNLGGHPKVISTQNILLHTS